MSPDYFSPPGTFSPRETRTWLWAHARPPALGQLEAAGWGWGGWRGVTRLLPIYSSAPGNTASFSLHSSRACVCKRSRRITISRPLSLALATPSLAPYSSHPFYTPLIPVTGLQHAVGFKSQLTWEPLHHTQFHPIGMHLPYMGKPGCASLFFMVSRHGRHHVFSSLTCCWGNRDFAGLSLRPRSHRRLIVLWFCTGLCHHHHILTLGHVLVFHSLLVSSLDHRQRLDQRLPLFAHGCHLQSFVHHFGALQDSCLCPCLC